MLALPGRNIFSAPEADLKKGRLGCGMRAGKDMETAALVAQERSSALDSLALRSWLKRHIALAVRAIPACRPLPYVSAHVLESELSLPIGGHRRGVAIPVFLGVVSWERALPGIGILHASFLIAGAAPRAVASTIRCTARSVLPFDFGRKTPTFPLAVGLGIIL